MLGRELDSRVTEHLAYTFADFARKNELTIGAEIESFITNLVRESLIWREMDWSEREIDISLPENYETIISRITSAVGEVLSLATQLRQYEILGHRKRILLINVVDSVRQKWCGIFPFCR